MIRTENFFPDSIYEELNNEDFYFLEQSTHRSNGIKFQAKTYTVTFFFEEIKENKLTVQMRPIGIFFKDDILKMEIFLIRIVNKIKDQMRLLSLFNEFSISYHNACIYTNDTVQWSIFAYPDDIVSHSFMFYEHEKCGGPFNDEHPDVPSDLKKYYDSYLKDGNSNKLVEEHWKNLI